MAKKTRDQSISGRSQQREPRTSRRARSRTWGWLLPVLLLAPLELGAKGCDSAVVGDDCAPGNENTHCAGSGGGTSTGGSASSGGRASTGGVGTSGSVGKGGASTGTGGSTGSGGAANSKTCGGLLGSQCASGQYCDFPASARCGAADQTGLCQPVPDACAEIFQPVCGCDGKTYGNACEAATASVSVAAVGACASTASDCGGLLGTACRTGEYCDYPVDAQCGAADQTGTCATIPGACDAIYQPVCGCDGKTYGNACEAGLASMSVASKGECPPTVGKACGARLGNTCASSEYCSFTPEAMCGRADATGTCAAIPAGCTKELVPVCGCNGVTYSNACLAASAGVSVDHVGTCPTTTPGEVCGGLHGTQCSDKAQYCAFPPEAKCGAADQTGTCASRPDACTTLYDPVCGCDGKTYGNSCSAASAGVSVASAGECP